MPHRDLRFSHDYVEEPGPAVPLQRADTGAAGGPVTNHGHTGTGDGGGFDAANLESGEATDGQVFTADGAGGADWEDLPPLADHDHTGDAGDGGQLGVSALDSSGADAGDVLTADGTGGVVWAPQSGGGGGTPSVYTQYAEIVPLAVSTAQMGVAGVELRHGESDIAYGWWVVPGDWAGGNITIRPRGGAASAGDVRIGSNAVYRQRAGEANTLLASNNNVTLTVAAGEVADLPLITLPDTNIVAGDPLEVRIQRAGTHVDDSLANPLTMQEWVVSYTVGVTVAEGGTPDAADVTYTPATAADWDGDADPGNLDDAVDQLAERVDDLEGAGGGGGAVLIHGKSLKSYESLTASSSAYAWKGNYLRPMFNVTLHALGVLGDWPQGITLKFGVFTVSGGAIASVLYKSTTGKTLPATLDTNPSWSFVWEELDSPVALTAGTLYLVAAGCSSGAGSYALPVVYPNNVANGPFPIHEQATGSGRCAAADPDIGTAVDNYAPGVVALEAMWSYT